MQPMRKKISCTVPSEIRVKMHACIALQEQSGNAYMLRGTLQNTQQKLLHIRNPWRDNFNK